MYVTIVTCMIFGTQECYTWQPVQNTIHITSSPGLHLGRQTLPGILCLVPFPHEAAHILTAGHPALCHSAKYTGWYNIAKVKCIAHFMIHIMLSSGASHRQILSLVPFPPSKLGRLHTYWQEGCQQYSTAEVIVISSFRSTAHLSKFKFLVLPSATIFDRFKQVSKLMNSSE